MTDEVAKKTSVVMLWTKKVGLVSAIIAMLGSAYPVFQFVSGKISDESDQIVKLEKDLSDTRRVLLDNMRREANNLEWDIIQLRIEGDFQQEFIETNKRRKILTDIAGMTGQPANFNINFPPSALIVADNRNDVVPMSAPIVEDLPNLNVTGSGAPLPAPVAAEAPLVVEEQSVGLAVDSIEEIVAKSFFPEYSTDDKSAPNYEYRYKVVEFLGQVSTYDNSLATALMDHYDEVSQDCWKEMDFQGQALLEESGEASEFAAFTLRKLASQCFVEES